MQTTSPFYSEIIRRLEAVRTKELRLSLAYGLLTTLFVFLVIFFDAVLLERTFSFGTLGRTIIFFLSVLTIAGSFLWFAGRPLLKILGILRSDDNAAIASRVGDYFPHIRDRLLNALQLYENREKLYQNYSIKLIDAAFANLYQDIQPLDFTQTVSNARLKKMQRFVGLVGGIMLLVFVIAPSGFLESLYRIAQYNTSFAASQPIQFIIEPGNKEVIRGEDVPIVIRTLGKPVQSLQFFTRQEGQLEFESQTLALNLSGYFATEISNIKQSTEYYAAVEDVKSDKYKITALDRPLIRSLRLKVTPPFYTKLPSRFLDENIGDASVYMGTNIEFELISSKPLTSAMMMMDDKSSISFAVNGSSAKGTMSPRKSVNYYFVLQDKDGLINSDPVMYSLKIVPDEHPTIEILSPGKNVQLTEKMKLDLYIRAKDDFGFSKLMLAHRLVQSRYEPPQEKFSYIDIPYTFTGMIPLDVQYLWDLSDFNLVPEDVLAYYVEVFDNDNISGPKSGRSEIFLIRLPSLEEVFSDVAESHEQSIESMRELVKEAEQLKKDIEDMQREMKKNREKMDWQQQQKAQQMMQRYEAMKKKLDETIQKMDEMTKQMEENKLISNETLEKYLELQKLMEQLQSPELQEALKRLQQTMKQLSPEEMRQALEQMKFSEEQFRRSLERTIELLKRIHIEQKIEELIKRADELMQMQEALEQQTAEANPSDKQKLDDLARRQEDLKKQMESLEREAKALREKMEEFAKEMPLDQMSAAQQELEKQQIDQKMQQAAQQMQAGKPCQAQQHQQKAMQGLRQFKEQMQAVQEAMMDKQMKQIVNEMKRQLQNLLELSKRQEELKDETKGLDPNSQRFRDNAERQMETMNDLGSVAQALSELAKKTFAIGPDLGKEIGNALRQMDEAMRNMENRNPAATLQQQQAMSSLNRAAMIMQNTLSGMMQGRQAGMGMAGLMSRLNQMIGQQMGINIATQQAMGGGQGQGEGLTAEQQAEYQRLAAQQGAVQKSLEQLAQEAKNAGEFSKLLGDLDKVAEEMKEVQTDLEQGNVNPETIKKQERIFSRLLDSQRSLRERDYEKRRRAETAKNIQRLSPAEIDLTTQEGKSRLRRELLKVLEGKYSKDYEELIRKYFELLEKEEIQQ